MYIIQQTFFMKSECKIKTNLHIKINQFQIIQDRHYIECNEEVQIKGTYSAL